VSVRPGDHRGLAQDPGQVTVGRQTHFVRFLGAAGVRATRKPVTGSP